MIKNKKHISDKKRLNKYLQYTSVIVVLAVLVGLIIVPAFAACIENGSKNKTEKNMYIIKDSLTGSLSQEIKGNDRYWRDMIETGHSKKLLNAIKEKHPKCSKINIDDFYLKYSNDELVFLSKRFPDISGVYMSLSDYGISSKKISENKAKQIKNEGRKENAQIDSIAVTGISEYKAGTIMDTKNPLKQLFTQNDNIEDIFSLEITARLMGGGERTLKPSEYTLTTSGIDMSKPGNYTAAITSNIEKAWSDTMTAVFTITVTDEPFEYEPLIVDAGRDGVYELAAWNWDNFVSDAENDSGEGKNFDASIIYYGGKYFYYPDGFVIEKSAPNTNPMEYCRSLKDKNKTSYYIIFNLENVYTPADVSESTETYAGDILLDNEHNIHIWQNGNEDYGVGWIRIYCDVKEY